VKPGVGLDRAVSWFIAIGMIAISTVVLLLIYPQLRQWFIAPVAAGGVLIGVDAVDWFRGRLDTFDPQGLLGLMGLHFFFIAPIMQVILNHWVLYVDPPNADWRVALGRMAVLNAAGLLIYRLIVDFSVRRREPRPVADLKPQAFSTVVGVGILLGMLGFAVEIYHLGGVSAYLNVSSQGQARTANAGTGWLLVIAESFPLLAFVAIIVAKRDRLRDHPVRLIILFSAFFVAQLLVGGLRGSRSNIIWPVLIGAGIVHLAVRHIPRRTMIATAMIGLAFMYVYGFYKSYGNQATAAIQGQIGVNSQEASTRSLSSVLLEDLGRSDIQALVLDRQRYKTAPLEHGRTYVGDLSVLVPNFVIPSTYPDKVSAGTDMLYGQGSFADGTYSTHIYGLAGEAILNFGPIGAVLSFIPLGFVVRFARRRYRDAVTRKRLAASLLVPTLSVVVVLMLGSDLGNLAFFLAKQVLPLAAVVLIAQKITGRPKEAEASSAGAAPPPSARERVGSGSSSGL
jgi:hypothetical protein